MVANYKRRKPSLVRNLWIFRRLIIVAVMGGVILWFIWANRQPVAVAFPFGLGTVQSSAGILILTSVLGGAVAGALTATAWLAWRKAKSTQDRAASTSNGAAARAKVDPDLEGDDDEPAPSSPSLTKAKPKGNFEDDLPPPDYASRTPEGFSHSKW